jgi:hypothetical protein
MLRRTGRLEIDRSGRTVARKVGIVLMFGRFPRPSGHAAAGSKPA